ncbi:MAG: cyclic-di-AMP receptor [Clostridiaceae bacterium]|nr:cyclic-di-AMP receptor [Clostridiaceae bacterium]
MKMIIAIISSEDADDLVYELNQNSFFVTKLSTMGGFLKKKSTTLMLGVDEPRVDEAISIIKKMSGSREQLVYTPPTLSGNAHPNVNMTVPMNMRVGGATVFLLNVEDFQKF